VAGVDFFADFFNANGEDLWSSVDEKIRFVLAHHGGRRGYRQLWMWQVALLVELVSETMVGTFSIAFELEGKASLLFPMRKAFQNSRTWLRGGGGVAVCQCSTVALVSV